MPMYKERMQQQTIALFGEAEKGTLALPLTIHSLIELNDQLGHPPEESHGVDFAVQFLLYGCAVVYIRVAEEGFSHQHYTKGFDLLLQSPLLASTLSAICLPGVGNKEIIHATKPLCRLYHTLLITTEKDLYDYLTALSPFAS